MNINCLFEVFLVFLPFTFHGDFLGGILGGIVDSVLYVVGDQSVLITNYSVLLFILRRDGIGN